MTRHVLTTPSFLTPVADVGGRVNNHEDLRRGACHRRAALNNLADRGPVADVGVLTG